MHLFHKWETIDKSIVKLKTPTYTFGGPYEREGVACLQICNICGKKRAFWVGPFNKKIGINYEYYETKLMSLKK